MVFTTIFLACALTSATPQEIAETKARYAASHAMRGHVLGHLGFGTGGRFEGVGWSTSPHNVPTCVGSGRVLGDATYRGVDGRYYRCRIYEGGSSRGRAYARRRVWSRRR